MSRIDAAGVSLFARPIYGRKATLILRNDGKGLDLSTFHVKFKIGQMDDETPNTSIIRVYNMADETVNKVRGEFDSVVLQAGYEKGRFGTIFAGSIKQFGVGRENNRDSYLDLLCADGDIGYNFGVVAATISKDRNLRDAIDTAAKAMGTPVMKSIPPELGQAQINIRGKVLWGMARDVLRDAARTLDASWSIQNGEVQLTPLNSFAPGHVVVLDAASGLVGVPELNDDGVSARSLLNPLIRVGGLVQIDNKLINKVVQQSPTDIRRFNSFTEPNTLAKINADGLYQVLVAEHHGDTRGNEWYTDLVCVAVQSDTGEVLAYG